MIKLYDNYRKSLYKLTFNIIECCSNLTFFISENKLIKDAVI